MRGAQCYLQSCVRGGELGRHAEALFPPSNPTHSALRLVAGKLHEDRCFWHAPLPRSPSMPPTRVYLGTPPPDGLGAGADPEERRKGCMLLAESKAHALLYTLNARTAP
ncbi:uncharacterized protein Tco025E_09652 [Trypanosoma conorhini]|uniref:Uncharacterized protein n=1 Tax=Trypanosoma conorhini TaxID=83891 RepID=A0A3R7LGE1_9TRYP|nr:uncharacterized protein Tco025E_09652 [Trypanosoma conorhini]RNE96775.1 hypothetical protein Tco025E_09652 [Trypanosoma conorhini]